MASDVRFDGEWYGLAGELTLGELRWRSYVVRQLQDLILVDTAIRSLWCRYSRVPSMDNGRVPVSWSDSWSISCTTTMSTTGAGEKLKIEFSSSTSFDRPALGPFAPL